jgi:hypothetical protein
MNATHLTLRNRSLTLRNRSGRHLSLAGARRCLLAALLAVLTAVLLAPSSASAASSVPGDFSSLVANNPKPYTVDNCRVEVGVVVDTNAYPNYRHVGGVRVNCGTYHSVIDATVALYYYNGSRWIQYGSSGYGVRYNQAGSGTGISGILRTPAYCVGGLRAYYWMVGATVRTERTGATVYSNYSADTQAGC